MSTPHTSPPTATSGLAGTAKEGHASGYGVETALDFWRSFDLNKQRVELDKQSLAIADRQEVSAASRKQLSADTRNFRKSLTDGNPISAKDFGAMLRAYQVEIDSLTNRAKAAETSFISLYKALYDAPDPADSLSEALRDEHALSKLREQVVELKEERENLLERTANATALEKRVLDLDAKLAAADQRAAEEANTLLEQEQVQWVAAQQKTIEAYEMREQELMHQLRDANDSIRRMQASSDEMQQQLNNSRSELEHLKSARASVNDMAVEDLERTRAEANSLRRRCHQLENRLAGRPDDSDIDVTSVTSSIGPSALSAELAARDVQISQLTDQVSALQEVLGGKDREKQNEFAKLTASITEKDTELEKLRDTLNQLPSLEEFDTMRRQFETLQAFQTFDAESSIVNDDDRSELESNSTRSDVPQHDTLEKRLLNKVKSMEGRLTKMRVELTEREGKITELQGTVRAYEDQSADQKALIAKLEEGINMMTGEMGGLHAMKRRAVAASKNGAEVSASGKELSVGDGDAEAAWDWGDKHQAEGLQNIIQEEPSMLDIVAGQRDRFRSRTMELEDDNRKLMERFEKVMSEMDSLKNDNVRLYEKLQFVQSYRQTNTSLTPGPTVNPISNDVGISDDDDGGGLIGKYRSLYEDMVNPYTIFNRRERHKRMSEMSAPERITLRAGQKVLSTKTSRLIVFFYVISLHVFVALVLSFSSSVCDSDSVTTKAKH